MKGAALFRADRYSRSPIAIASLLASLAAAALVATVPDVRMPADGPMVPWWLHQYVTVGIGVLSIGVALSRFERLFRYLAALQGLLVLLAVGLFPTSLLAVIALTIPCLFSVGLYERHPGNLVASIGLVTLIALAWSGHTEVEMRSVVAFAITGISISLSLSTLSHHREASISLQSRLNALEENVAELTRANSVIQDYAREMQESAREAERMRLTRDIHDIVGYSFTNAMMMAEAAKFMALKEPEEIVAFLESLRSTIRNALKEVKGALREFRSQEQPPMPTKTALYLLIQVFSISTGVKVTLEPGNTEWSRLAGSEYAIYHFVQEALINAFIHGRARNVTILLWNTETEIQTQILDDGEGASGNVIEGIGIGGMRERAAEVGGRIEIEPLSPGFTITMILPADGSNESSNLGTDR